MKYAIIIGLSSLGLVFFFLWVFGVFDQRNPLDSYPEKVSLKIDFIEVNKTVIGQGEGKEFSDLNKTLPDVLPYIIDYCYGVTMVNDSTTHAGLKSFYQKPYVEELEQDIKKEFGDLSKEKKEITTCFKRLKYHFPKEQFPQKIVLANSNFVTNASCYNSVVLVGLERYLGKNNALIQSLNSDEFPMWVKRGMDKKFLTRDVLSAWISTHIVPEDSTGYLLSEICRWGKIHLLTEMALRLENKDITPELLLRWSKEELNWATKNEKNFLDYLYKQELLFSEDEKIHAFLLNNGPYSSGFSADSPDRMGQFLGWKMLRKYVFDEDVELKDLKNIEYDEILKNYVK